MEHTSGTTINETGAVIENRSSSRESAIQDSRVSNLKQMLRAHQQLLKMSYKNIRDMKADYEMKLETAHAELETAHTELETAHTELETAHAELETAHAELEAVKKCIDDAYILARYAEIILTRNIENPVARKRPRTE